MYKFLWTGDFGESFEKLDHVIQEYVKEKLRFLSALPEPLRLAKKLKDKNDIYRFRAGSYRIVFRLEKNMVILLTIKHRKDIYKK